MAKGMKKIQKTAPIKTRTGCRRLADIEADLQDMSPFYSALTLHVRNPLHRHQTGRLLRHLLIEHALTKSSPTDAASTLLAILQWLTSSSDNTDWNHRATRDLYQSFCRSWEQAAILCPTRASHVHEGLQAFKWAAEPWLLQRLPPPLRSDSPRKDSTPKRPLSHLPSIPE